MLADGSEYRGDYDPGDAALEAFHRPRIDTLVAAGADLLAVETIPTLREARVLVRLLDESGVPAWIAYTGRDGATTAAGEPFAEAIAVASSGRDVVAVGVNCTAPQHVRALLKIARTSTDLPLVGLPEPGRHVGSGSRTWRSDKAGSWEPAVVAAWTASGPTGSAVVAALGRPISSGWPQHSRIDRMWAHPNPPPVDDLFSLVYGDGHDRPVRVARHSP